MGAWECYLEWGCLGDGGIKRDRELKKRQGEEEGTAGGNFTENVFTRLTPQNRAYRGHIPVCGHVWRRGCVCDRLPDGHRTAQIQGTWRGECQGPAPTGHWAETWGRSAAYSPVTFFF